MHIQKSKQPPLLALSSPHSSPNSVSSLSMRSPRDSALTSTGRSLQLASTNIHFPNARVNSVHGGLILCVALEDTSGSCYTLSLHQDQGGVTTQYHTNTDRFVSPHAIYLINCFIGVSSAYNKGPFLPFTFLPFLLPLP